MKSLAVWGVSTILLTGCMTPLPELSFEQWSAQILDHEIPTPTNDLATDPGQRQFSFATAFKLAIAASPDLSSSDLPLELARVDLEQAQSVVWPRFSLQGVYEIPLEDDGAETQFDGGLRIDYDLTKALFKRDFMTAAALKRQQALIEQAILLQDLKTQLLERIAEKYVLEQKIVTVDKTLALLEQEQKALDSVAKIKGLQVASDWPLEEKRFTYLRMKRFNTSRLQQINRALRQTLGLPIEGAIEITDTPQLFADLAEQYAPPHSFSRSFEQALQQQPDVKRVVLEIMAAVLNLRKAEMEGLPRIGLSLGYGDYSLRQSEEDAGLVGFVNLTVPLFDFGDNARKQEIAQINEQIARSKLRSVTRHASSRLQTALGEARSAKDEFEETRSWHRKSSQRVQQINKLHRDKQINRKDRMQAIITNARIHLDLLDARLKWMKGLISLAAVLPDHLISGTTAK